MGKHAPKSGHEIVRELQHREDCQILRQSGSHVIVKLPDGSTVIVPAHSKDLGKGLLCKILKTLAAAGVTLGVLIALLYQFGFLVA